MAFKPGIWKAQNNPYHYLSASWFSFVRFRGFSGITSHNRIHWLTIKALTHGGFGMQTASSTLTLFIPSGLALFFKDCDICRVNNKDK
jgi:hypothetical protein